MLRLKRLTSLRPAITVNSRVFFTDEEDKLKLFSLIPSHHPSHLISNRFFDFYQLGNKATIEKERARLADEMNRGYFADISELKQHGGKISIANKTIVPATAATKFPSLEVSYSDGINLKLPTTFNGIKGDSNTLAVPKASLMCLSFRASSQPMVNSWSIPFLDAFSNSEKVQLYEVSFVDSWLLSRNLIKKLLLRMMRKSNPEEKKGLLQRQIVYSFGDHYDFRKELKILNLLTGYIFLVDKFGRIRWQGSGLASKEELSFLLSCSSLLLEED